MEKNKREEWIDSIKGLTLFGVMWCHMLVDAPFFSYMVAVTVPMFLIITGYLYSDKPNESYSFKKMANRILKPYIIFSILSIISFGIYDYFINREFVWMNVKTNVLKSITRLWNMDDLVFSILPY